MKQLKRILLIGLFSALMILPLALQMSPTTPLYSSGNGIDDVESQIVDLGDGRYIEVGPDEVLHRYVLTEQGWEEWTGISSGLTINEFGNRSDTFTDLDMTYLPTNSTTETSVSVPTGVGWEGYRAEVTVSDITENRTWTTNPGFQGGTTNWTLATVGAAGNSVPYSQWADDGHGVDDDCLNLTILSNNWPSGSTFWYDLDDRAFASQTMTVPRLEVTWSGFIMDYNISNTHFSSMGLYVAVMNDVPSDSVWQMTLPQAGGEGVWLSTGIQNVPASNFDISTIKDVDVEVGLWSKRALGYEPGVPNVLIDNFEFYFKTKATPSQINLMMDGILVSDQGSTNTGIVTEIPETSWTTNPIELDFSWWPTPTNPNPNRTIIIEFNVDTNMFARRTSIVSSYEQNPTSYGEYFSTQNGTAVDYLTYFKVGVPEGYSNRYFFNISIPNGRDVRVISRPQTGTLNLTDWTYVSETSTSLNISAYEFLNEAQMEGYWRFQSRSANMITNLALENPQSMLWEPSIDLRAGNSTKIQISVDSAYAGSIANVTLFDPDGATWISKNITVTGGGVAETDYFTFDGTNSSAGSWMVQAAISNIDTGGSWNTTGFFRRTFTVTHVTEFSIEYPADAASTGVTNATFGELVLVVLKITDTDSNIGVDLGTMEYTWAAGSGTFDNIGSGEYTKILNTTLIGHKGQYTIDFNWNCSSFDDASGQLIININYPAILSSPQYPGVSATFGTSQIFTVNLVNGNEGNGTGIPGALITCNWTGPYSVSDNGDGSYDVELDVTGFPIEHYSVIITANAPFVETQEESLDVDITKIFTSKQLSRNQLIIPLGESASFNFTWTETISGNPITDGTSYISCDWGNHIVSHLGAGVYNITIGTIETDPITPSNEWVPINFTVNRQYYENQTFVIYLRIRSHETLFRLDTPVEQTSFGQNITVLVSYMDVDLDLGITNDTQYVHITVTSPTTGSMIYTSYSTMTDGLYNISIPSNQWGSIGWKDLIITIEWIGSSQKYSSQTIETSVRVLGTDTEISLEIAPTATYYLNNFTFTIFYYDLVNASRISNSSYGGGNIALQITAITSGHLVTQSSFQISEIGTSGTYQFNLDTSYFGAIGSFKFQIDFLWKSGASPLFENQSIVVTLIVLERPTYVDYVPVQPTPFGETAVFEFSYVDALGTYKIENSSTLIISLNEVTVDYTLTYDSGDRIFSIWIDTTSLLDVGTFFLHVNITWNGSPFYQSISSHSFTVIVSYRTTQLEKAPYVSGSWGTNVTIVFTYTDVIAGSSSGMTGILSLDIDSDYYSVIDIGNGMYEVEIDTSVFPSDGQYVINATIIYTGVNNANNATLIFDFIVLTTGTQLGYESPDPAPYLTNVSLTITYVDDVTGTGIYDATVIVECSGAAFALVLNSNYWVTYIGSGSYLIEINTTALGSIGSFICNVSTSKVGAPFYTPASKLISTEVVERLTIIVVTQTPGETPFLENIILKFRFEDYLTGEHITITQTDIVLTHGELGIVIANVNYTLIDHLTYYEIIFNSTLLDSLDLVTGHSLNLTIYTGASEPYYAARYIVSIASTIERLTQILFPLIDATPYGDNITILLRYIDYLSQDGIIGASVDISCTNLTIFTSTITDLLNGDYSISIPSDQFGNIGIVYFTITLSKAGTPFFASRSAYDTPASIRTVIMSVTVEIPAAGSIPIGELMVLNITVEDTDHGNPVLNAIVTTDWTALFGTEATIVEVGMGVYRITLNTTGIPAQIYDFTVQVELAFHRTEVINIQVQPGAAVIEIILERVTYYADWGEYVLVSFQVQEPYHNTFVWGLNATILFNGVDYNCTDHGNGTYSTLIPTADGDYGYYEPRITVSATYYQTRQKSFTLIVAKAYGNIITEFSDYSVIVNTTVDLWVYLNDTVSNQPVLGGTISIEWNNTVYAALYNGTPGFYEISINKNGIAIGTHDMDIIATASNHVFLDLRVNIHIIPIPTNVGLPDEDLFLNVYLGQSFLFSINYTDIYDNPITNATVSYTMGSVTGYLTEVAPGVYEVLIDTSSLPAQNVYLRIIATKAGYATYIRSFPITIVPITTDLVLAQLSLDGYYGDTVVFRVYLNDTLNNLPIAGAIVDATWEGGAAVIVDHENGTYTISVSLEFATPRLYELVISTSKANYQSVAKSADILIKATPAQIYGPTYVSVPVNDPVEIIFNIIDSVRNESVSNINGIAYWIGIGDTSLELLENGSYQLAIPDNLPVDNYVIEIVFSTSIYTISTFMLTINVRLVETAIVSEETVIQTYPGETIVVRVSYIDLDHNIGLSGVTPTVDYDENALSFDPTSIEEPYNNGTYLLYFTVNEPYSFTITITFTLDDYKTSTIDIYVQSDISAAQQSFQTFALYGGSLLLLFVGLLFFYVRVYSVPKLIRVMNSMISKLEKGNAPKPYNPASRLALSLAIINESLHPIGVEKSSADTTEESITMHVPEVNELLDRLIFITGLGEAEVAAFRMDLSRMNPSERPGFLKEVIAQEEARRAEELESLDTPVDEIQEILDRPITPSELSEMKSKLLRKGMSDDEIEVILKEAEYLSKADLEALIDSLGLD